MNTATLPCPTCSGDGTDTHQDRHTGTNKDTCRTCGGEGVIPARTGETPESSFRPTTTSGGGTEAEYVMVPREPTPEMIVASVYAVANLADASPTPEKIMGEAWAAMLAAAPTPTDRHGVAGGDAGLRETWHATGKSDWRKGGPTGYVLCEEWTDGTTFEWREVSDILAEPALTPTAPFQPPASRGEAVERMRDDGDADPEGTARMNYPSLFAEPAPPSPRVSGDREAAIAQGYNEGYARGVAYARASAAIPVAALAPVILPAFQDRLWFPEAFCDEMMPAGKKNPEDWLQVEGHACSIGTGDPDDAELYAPFSVSNREVVAMTYQENFQRVAMTFAENGTAVFPEGEPTGNAFWLYTDDETGADNLREMIEQVRENHMDEGPNFIICSVTWSPEDCYFQVLNDYISAPKLVRVAIIPLEA